MRGQPDAPPKIEEALIILQKGQTKEAEFIFQTLAERVEDDIQQAAAVYRHLGALAFLNDTQKALAAYRRATELDPNDAMSWNQLGHLLHRVGSLDEAEAAYLKVTTLGVANGNQEDIAISSGNLALVYRTRGDLDQAEAMFQKSLALFQAVGAAPQITQMQELLARLREP